MAKTLIPPSIGLAWFRQEDYPALLEIFEDADKMHRDWDDWVKSAEEAEQRLEARGQRIDRVYIYPTTFPGWCAQQRVGVNREGRHKFVSSVMAEKYRNQR
jgi:hypothetical protein